MSHSYQEGGCLQRHSSVENSPDNIFPYFYLFSNCITTIQYLKSLKVILLGEAKINTLNNTLYCKQKTRIS